MMTVVHPLFTESASKRSLSALFRKKKILFSVPNGADKEEAIGSAILTRNATQRMRRRQGLLHSCAHP